MDCRTAWLGSTHGTPGHTKGTLIMRGLCTSSQPFFFLDYCSKIEPGKKERISLKLRDPLRTRILRQGTNTILLDSNLTQHPLHALHIMAYTSGASSVRRFCEGMPASPDAVSEKRNAGATWRGRRSRSCPAALECEEAASPTRSDAEDTHTLETHCSESTGSHNNAESCYYSETPVALPSLVDDRESSCSSMSACTPLLYPSNPSRLNASAPSFQPYVNAMQPQHQTLHQRVPAPPALLHRVPGSAYQHVPNHGHQGHPHSGHSNRYMGYEDTMQHSVSSSGMCFVCGASIEMRLNLSFFFTSL